MVSGLLDRISRVNDDYEIFFGSVEIVQDMFVKTLLGVLPPAHPPHACGELGNILSNISCEPVLSFEHDRHPHDAISVEKVERMVE